MSTQSRAYKGRDIYATAVRESDLDPYIASYRIIIQQDGLPTIEQETFLVGSFNSEREACEAALSAAREWLDEHDIEPKGDSHTAH